MDEEQYYELSKYMMSSVPDVVHGATNYYYIETMPEDTQDPRQQAEGRAVISLSDGGRRRRKGLWTNGSTYTLLLLLKLILSY